MHQINYIKNVRGNEKIMMYAFIINFQKVLKFNK